jgi:pyruvate ferredoxin oxidoreductase gamma subunit
MYRIRLHGRGGQGTKTASRILGSALFAAGYEVQDAPRYGAERRGAPLFATVRAAREPVRERGPVARPDLVVVADDTLVPVAAAGVLAGVGERTVLLLCSAVDADTWRERLQLAGPVLTLAPGAAQAGELRFVGAACAGAAARLLGMLSREHLEQALRDELAGLGARVLEENLARARAAWEAMAGHAGCVAESPATPLSEAPAPEWVELPFDAAPVSAPDIRAAATSVQVRTGLWRTMRPVLDLERCHRCHWVCSTLCPDGAISVEPDGAPRIDYDHCKGCMICVAVCPHHAIGAVPETSARAEEVRP